jgi:hypothetical protein
MKQADAKNKQNLAQYTWQEQITISLKGKRKSRSTFRSGWDPMDRHRRLPWIPLRTLPSGGRLKQQIVEKKKKEEYKDYADEMKALAQ